MITSSTLENKFDRFFENFYSRDIDEIIHNFKIIQIVTNSLENQIKDSSQTILNKNNQLFELKKHRIEQAQHDQ